MANIADLTQEQIDKLNLDLAEAKAQLAALKEDIPSSSKLKIGDSWDSITKRLDFNALATPEKEKIIDLEAEVPLQNQVMEGLKEDKALLYAMAGHMKKMSEQFVKFPRSPSTLGEVIKESFDD